MRTSEISPIPPKPAPGDDDRMEGWRPAVRRSDAALAVGLVCGTTNVAGIALFLAAAPYVGFLD